MWKYLAVFAVLVLLAVYIARQDEHTAAQSAQDAAHSGNNAVSAETNEHHAQENVGNSERHAPSWYGFFRWPNGTTTWAIILTLLAIAEQTRETAKAATASRKSVDAIVVGQRAQLVVVPEDPIPNIEAGGMPRVNVEVRNVGATPAYNCIYDTWIEVLPAPFTDFTDAATRQDPPFPFTIYANSPSAIAIECRLMRQLAPGELTALKSGRKLLCLRIRFNYVDAVGEEIWQNFGLVAQSNGMGHLPKYNDSGISKKRKSKGQNPN